MWFFIIGLLLLGGLYLSAHYNWWRPKVSHRYPRILMYHSINREVGALVPDLVVTPEQFETQLKYLMQRGYRFYTLSELVQSPHEDKAVALTFDDGYRDNFTEMFPLLKQYDAKATIYLSPEFAGMDLLTTDQIKEMHASGRVEFGAHTMSHINVSTAEKTIAEDEIRRSKSYVEQLVGYCQAFAYPFGRYHDDNAAFVKQCGFTSAVTVKKGIEPLNNLFRIKRISILRSTNALQFHIAMTRGRYRV